MNRYPGFLSCTQVINTVLCKRNLFGFFYFFWSLSTCELSFIFVPVTAINHSAKKNSHFSAKVTKSKINYFVNNQPEKNKNFIHKQQHKVYIFRKSEMITSRTYPTDSAHEISLKH